MPFIRQTQLMVVSLISHAYNCFRDAYKFNLCILYILCILCILYITHRDVYITLKTNGNVSKNMHTIGCNKWTARFISFVEQVVQATHILLLGSHKDDNGNAKLCCFISWDKEFVSH